MCCTKAVLVCIPLAMVACLSQAMHTEAPGCTRRRDSLSGLESLSLTGEDCVDSIPKYRQEQAVDTGKASGRWHRAELEL